MRHSRIGAIATRALPCLAAAGVIAVAATAAMADPDPPACYAQLQAQWNCCGNGYGEQCGWPQEWCGDTGSGPIYVQMVDPSAVPGFTKKTTTFVGNCVWTIRSCIGGECYVVGSSTQPCNNTNPDMESEPCEYEDS